jgi:ferric-dicitrate binding protein FerR (iron transport regulator)
VLGTSFNIKSYEDEGQVEATLIEGSLRIIPSSALKTKFKSVTLKPNEKATYKKEESILSVKELDVVHPEERQRRKKRLPEMKGLEISQIESIISWKDNELIFWNETFEDISVKMERWYGISIVIEDEKLKSYRYSGKFIYNETINQVMDILALTTPIGYSLDKNVLTIYEKE